MPDSKVSKPTSNLRLPLWGSLLALLGLAISFYLTLHHIEVRIMGATDAFCNISQIFSCDDIARSKYAELFGIPLGVFGIGYFLGLIALLGVAYFHEEYAYDTLPTFAILVGIGVVVSLVLGLVAFWQVGVACIGCIGVYVVSFALAGLTYLFRDEIPSGWSWKNVSNGIIYPILAVGIAIVLYKYLKPIPRDFKLDLPGIGEDIDTSNRTSKPASILSSTLQNIKIDKSPFSGYGEDYRKGSDDAKVVMVVFSDFECPACGTVAGVTKQLAAQFRDKILIVFKNYPLDESCNPNINRRFHEYACQTAVMARCAGSEGLFWQYHDLAFENINEISADKLKDWARQTGLSDQRIEECMASPGIVDKIKHDISVGDKLGVSGTPAIYINGREVVGGRSLDALYREIQQLLAE